MLPPYYPPTTPLLGGLAVSPRYTIIYDIIDDLWNECSEYEERYMFTKDPAMLTMISVTIMKVNFWQDLCLESDKSL